MDHSQSYKYLLSKSILQYGLPTTVICGVIYYFISRVDTAFSAVAGDLFIPVFVTCLICSLTLIPGISSDGKHGKVPDMTDMARPFYDVLPNSAVLNALILSLVSMFLYTGVVTGILMTVASFLKSEPVIPANLYWIGKSVFSGVFISLHVFKFTACTVVKSQN